VVTHQGRPRGSKNKRTQALIDEFEAQAQVKPLQVMTEAMTWFLGRARSLRKHAPPLSSAAQPAHEERIAEAYLAAAALARAAAPYLHARLSAVEVMNAAPKPGFVFTLRSDHELTRSDEGSLDFQSEDYENNDRSNSSSSL
jgi:hypothetical protein